MKVLIKLKTLLKNKAIKPKEVPGYIYRYVVGTSIDYLYYFKPKLLPRWFKSQLEWRHSVMNQVCYNNSECISGCGCSCTELQAVSKPCKNNCYPPFFSKKLWKWLENNPETLNVITSQLYAKNNR